MDESQPEVDFLTLDGGRVLEAVGHDMYTTCVSNEKVVHKVVWFKTRELPDAEFCCVYNKRSSAHSLVTLLNIAFDIFNRPLIHHILTYFLLMDGGIC